LGINISDLKLHNKGTTMYQKIIVSLALDHGIGQKAIEAALQLKSEGAEIIAVHVHEPLQGSIAGSYMPEDAARIAVKNAKQQLAERLTGTPDIKAVLLKGHSGRAITNYAEEIGADCIIVGSHKPGLVDYFLGSTAARVVRHAPCSVHVLR
jgi:nucleotide-binding universal stress UspA family protein